MNIAEDPWRSRWRRMYLGLTTVMGLARNGYFIPYRFAGAVPPYTNYKSYAALEALFGAHTDVFYDYAGKMGQYLHDLLTSAAGPPPAPRLMQDWFPPFDALAAYTMVRESRPRIILEIGGGHSTRVLTQAVADSGLETKLTVIDPQPRRALDILAQRGRIALLQKPVQAVNLPILSALEAGDILSLDGSHILMPGSDVDVVLNHVLPTLPRGVRIHFHDIFLPDSYPRSWTWRAYNEQQGVAGLLGGAAAEILFASRFVLTRLPAVAAQVDLERLPSSRALASSLWLEWKGYPEKGGSAP